MSLKRELHDRLWSAFQRWQTMRAEGERKFDLKMRGIRECGDSNCHTRNVIFSGETLRSYERVLGHFVAFAREESGVTHLEEIGKKEFRDFMDRAIEAGLSAKTLKGYLSALSKLGSLIGKSQAFIGLAAHYSKKIRDLTRAGLLAGPARATPSLAILERAIEILRAWDARHFDRTGDPRAYHLAARLQRETSCRRISATERVTAASLRDNDQIVLVGKGGKEQTFTLSPELHRDLKAYLTLYPGRLADKEGYRSAYARAMKAAGGRVLGTHGARRAAAQEAYRNGYHEAIGSGVSPKEAADRAAGNAIERLGHCRNRQDHRRWYLGR